MNAYINNLLTYNSHSGAQEFYELDVIKRRLGLLRYIKTPDICFKNASLGERRWLLMGRNDYLELENYVLLLYEVSSQIQTKDETLTAHLPSLMEHIHMMSIYLRELWKHPAFRSFFPKGTSVEFLNSLALLHDFSRFIFNGSLKVTDLVSDLLIENLLPDFPGKAYLHSIKWLTSESAPSHLDNVPLIMKALDSLGKAERNPEIFFEKKGGYRKWMDYQIKTGRFPLKIRGYGEDYWVSPKKYARLDKKYTLAGVSLIEEITGQRFTEFRKTAALSFPKEFSFTEYFSC